MNFFHISHSNKIIAKRLFIEQSRLNYDKLNLIKKIKIIPDNPFVFIIWSITYKKFLYYIHTKEIITKRLFIEQNRDQA